MNCPYCSKPAKFEFESYGNFWHYYSCLFCSTELAKSTVTDKLDFSRFYYYHRDIKYEIKVFCKDNGGKCWIFYWNGEKPETLGGYFNLTPQNVKARLPTILTFS